jgi:hypothetical protein
MAINAGPKIVEDGLVLYFDAGSLKSYPGTNSLIYDLSVNSNTLNLQNGAIFNNSNKGVFLLDGVNDLIVLPYSNYWDSNVFGTSNNFTIMIWVKSSSYFNWTCLIQKAGGASYSNGEGASLWINASGYQAVFSSGEGGNPSGSSVILSYPTSVTNNWFHLAFTGNGSTGSFYVNGLLHSSASLSGRSRTPVTSTNPVRIGTRGTGSGFVNGLINAPMFYTRGLSAQEIKQNFEALRGRFGI